MKNHAFEVVIESGSVRGRARLREDIRAGFEAIERGEYDDYDENTTKDLAADIKARGRVALALGKTALKGSEDDIAQARREMSGNAVVDSRASHTQS